jgi:hypothetical protein
VIALLACCRQKQKHNRGFLFPYFIKFGVRCKTAPGWPAGACTITTGQKTPRHPAGRPASRARPGRKGTEQCASAEKTGVGDGLMAPGCAPCPSERRVGLPRIRRPWERMRSAQLHVPSSPSFPATNERTARLHFRSAQVRPSKTRTCFASESSAAISPRHSCTPPLSYPWMIQPKTIEAKKTG